MLSTGCTLASCLKLMRYEPGVFRGIPVCTDLGHLGRMAPAGVGSGLSEVAGHLGRMDSAPFHIIEMKGEHKPRLLPAPLTWREF